MIPMNSIFRIIFPIIALIAFAMFYLGIAWHNRLSAGDDLFLLLRIQEYGALDAVFEFAYNKRYASFLLFNFTFSGVQELMEAKTVLFTYHVLFFILYIVSVGTFSKALLRKIGLTEISTSYTLTAILSIGTFFFVPQLIEIWFWPSATFIYAIPIVFTFLGMSCILQTERKPLHIVLLIISFFIIGGTLETFAVLICTLLILLLFLSINLKWSKYTQQKLILALLASLTLLVPSLLSGGISSRIELESAHQEQINTTITTITNVVGTFFDKNNLVILPLFFLAFYLGNRSQKEALLIPSFNTKKALSVTFIVLLLAGLITFIPLRYIFQGWGPHRGWLPFHFTLFLVFIFWMFIAGRTVKLRINSILSNFSYIVISGFLVGSLVSKKEALNNYSSAYDKMLTEISKQKEEGRLENFVVPRLPEPEYLVRFVITKDSTHSHNALFKDCMKSNFAIVSDSNEQIE